MNIKFGRFMMLLVAVIAVLIVTPAVLFAQDATQKTFATPEAAVKALAAAVSTGDMSEMQTIFGPGSQSLLNSGDPVDDRNAREVFAAAFKETWRLDSSKVNERTLYVGDEDWPFPVPLVKAKDGWRFDTASGTKEVHFRRIGRNELKVIQACSVYVDAQQEYASKGHDGKPAGLYAQKFASEPGKQDGLYWEAKGSEPLSPLGELIAEATEQGYSKGEGKPSPFHGYFFRILMAQGSSASGGAKSYLENGEMRNGFALVAFPAEYGNSGVMTFIVNQQGIVFEKNLGKETAKLAGEMKSFRPDSTWRRVSLAQE